MQLLLPHALAGAKLAFLSLLACEQALSARGQPASRLYPYLIDPYLIDMPWGFRSTLIWKEKKRTRAILDCTGSLKCFLLKK